ncbi:uncharacterized protein LOC113549740 [Rhopalosiphum maidis]|uniref:uncharacterized protein LOC113549740 n=1 Tax=Rhopalosiphum maidis TaxID=43146 RepID=UPI000EFFDBEC|nr:uncharacterized protein LOC113549740 [Rhopalosiphum maidis]
MKILWFCLFLISFSVCKVWCKPGDVKTIRTPNNMSMANSKVFNNTFKKSNPNTKQLLTWIKRNIKHGIRCVDVGIGPMKCETKTGSKFETKIQVWNNLPSSIRQQWATTVISNNLPKGVNIETD